MVLWNDALVNVTKIIVASKEIHCMVQVCPHGPPFLFSTIYATTLLSSRKVLWQNLKHIAYSYKGLWIVGGDFNDILYSNEKLEDVS